MLGLLAVASCEDRKPEPPKEAVVAPKPTPAPTPLASTPPPPACRILQSENGPPPSADAATWITLAEKASFTTRTSETGRELRFEGPGRVNACGKPVVVVAEGTAMGLPSAGGAPGQEQWMASPCAAVAYAAGITKITASANECIIQVSTGNARVWTPQTVRIDDPDGGLVTDAGVEDGWRRVIAKKTLRIRAVPSVKAAVADCEAKASAARDAEQGITDGGVGLGTVRSMRARELVRAACAVAEARAPDDERVAKAVKSVFGP
jgi:hypothetical protein